ncbi:MAG: 3-hydroxyacyl-CoA dehydrogenase NAD-binding domain-containing protein [Fulvivirga sp.]|nr:3-hydroxyacyl-CoA dehydrogenase NAD-binding domain-containing protein [Fulvivirga sp.]
MTATLANIKKVGIVGAGTMGQGIAQIVAMADYQTILYDIDQRVLDKAKKVITKNLDKGIEKGKVTGETKEKALKNLDFTTSIDDLTCDLIIEAIVEKLDVKRKVFQQLEEINSPETILASNTSSIPITQIGASLDQPERFVGMHFFNPAHIMKLVEIISGAATADEVASIARSFAEKLGKKTVMAKDSPGFIVNRVARHFYVEGLKILEEGVADVETIDNLVEASGFKMGPFRLMDLIGVDTNFSVTISMFNSFYQDPKFRPSRIQQQKVDAGHHGRKSGKGFYDYNK